MILRGFNRTISFIRVIFEILEKQRRRIKSVLVYIFKGLVIKSIFILASKSIRGTNRSFAMENTRIITIKLALILLP
jgi:hypothetical protein